MKRLPALSGIADEDQRRLRFLVTAHQLTGVERHNRLLDGARQENSAEHSWHVGICAMVLAPVVAAHVDLGRVLELLTVHDLVEIEVGDVPVYDEPARAQMVEVERAAAAQMFASVPGGEALLERWREFEAASSDEGRFARAVDRLQPMLLHWAGGGVVWREKRIPRSRLEGFVGVIADFWPPLGSLAEAIVRDAARRGDLIDDLPGRDVADVRCNRH